METTGKVKAISNKNGRYGINIDGDWYNGQGDSPVNKYDEVKIEFEKNGNFNNVKNITKISSSSNKFEEAGKSKVAGIMISYANDLAIADKIKVEEIEKYAKSFIRLHEELCQESGQKEETETKKEVEVVKM